MSRAVLVLARAADRAKAILWADKAPWGTRIEFKGPRRSLPQNDRMWAMLTEIAGQVRYHGLKLTADDWKLLFLDALKREVRMVPNLDGNGMVNLGRSSSDLSKGEFSELFEVIQAWAAANDVVFSEPHTDSADAQGQLASKAAAQVKGDKSRAGQKLLPPPTRSKTPAKAGAE